jgi:hypothetical protein
MGEARFDAYQALKAVYAATEAASPEAIGSLGFTGPQARRVQREYRLHAPTLVARYAPIVRRAGYVIEQTGSSGTFHRSFLRSFNLISGIGDRSRSFEHERDALAFVAGGFPEHPELLEALTLAMVKTRTLAATYAPGSVPVVDDDGGKPVR